MKILAAQPTPIDPQCTLCERHRGHPVAASWPVGRIDMLHRLFYNDYMYSSPKYIL